MSADRVGPTAGEYERAKAILVRGNICHHPDTCSEDAAVVADLATALAQARVEGFADWGPLFHRDLTRVLGIPESSALDATMQAVRDLQVRYAASQRKADAAYADGVQAERARCQNIFANYYASDDPYAERCAAALAGEA
jgi:hypothetical protein